MPINITELIEELTESNLIENAKLFSREFTGAGGKQGLFNETHNSLAQLMDTRIPYPALYQAATPLRTLNKTESLVPVSPVQYNQFFNYIAQTQVEPNEEVQLTDIIPLSLVGFMVQDTPFKTTHVLSNQTLLKQDIDIVNAHEQIIQSYRAKNKPLPKKHQKPLKYVWLEATPQTTNQPPINSAYRTFVGMEFEVAARFTSKAFPTEFDPTPKEKHQFAFGASTLVLFTKDVDLATEKPTVYINQHNSQHPSMVQHMQDMLQGECNIIYRYDASVNDTDTEIQTHIQTLVHANLVDANHVDALQQTIQKQVKYACVHLAINEQATSMNQTPLMPHIENILAHNASSNATFEQKRDTWHTVLAMNNKWSKVNKYNLTPTNYNKLYYEMTHEPLFNKVTVRQLMHHNLLLFMSERLFEIDEDIQHNRLYNFVPKNQAVTQTFLQNPNYSNEQKAVIVTQEPLVIVQAGAGSGKSYTLVERLKYLKEQGEDMSKVTVLSFTNIAAENITQRYPDVKSLTLSSLFNQIYSDTFTQQQLSQHLTVANAVLMCDPTDPVFTAHGTPQEMLQFLQQFYAHLIVFDNSNEIKKKAVDTHHAIKSLAEFVANNFERVVVTCDVIKQTTLDLQQIILNTLLTHDVTRLRVPKEFQQMNFVITDESQDISQYEYIILLKLVNIYKAQLMIIGDGSQTLYEFRNSNPKFLNAIENSGIFTPYKLNTNYRSRQTILNCANPILKCIEANKYADIQLVSNQLTTVTSDDLREHVQILNIQEDGSTPKEKQEYATAYLKQNDRFEEWVLEKYNSGGQIACLAYTNKEIQIMHDALEDILKRNNIKEEIFNLSPTRDKAKCFLSTAIRRYRNQLLAIPITHNHASEFIGIMHQAAMEKFKKAQHPTMENYAKDILDKVLVNNPIYTNLIHQGVQQTIPRQIIDDYVFNELIDREIQLNKVITLIRRTERDKVNPQQFRFLTTTIHTAKGLEFDNVILLHQAHNRMSTQEQLRILGVALTRAKENEFIINISKNTYLQNDIETFATSFATMKEEPILTTYGYAMHQLVQVEAQQKQQYTQIRDHMGQTINTPIQDEQPVTVTVDNEPPLPVDPFAQPVAVDNEPPLPVDPFAQPVTVDNEPPLPVDPFAQPVTVENEPPLPVDPFAQPVAVDNEPSLPVDPFAQPVAVDNEPPLPVDPFAQPVTVDNEPKQPTTNPFK